MNSIHVKPASLSLSTSLVGLCTRLIGIVHSGSLEITCLIFLFDKSSTPEFSQHVNEEDWLRGLIQIAEVFNMCDPDNVDQCKLGFYHRV